MNWRPPDTPTLFTPRSDVEDPKVTVLVPTLNEHITVATFCDWCHEGFAAIGVVGEILLIDSSTDETPAIALTHGARVLRVPKLGLGRAYRDALPFVRGDVVILGDADCTYDFRDLSGFLRAVSDGADLVMGSRFRGSMERGAMPFHHKYFGSPLTTLAADLLLRQRLTDIHCGMRAMPTQKLVDLGLRSDGWEYASEMIVNSIRRGYTITEIPISFFKDMEGRVSHVKRQGWATPFIAGWRTLRVLMTNAADFFVVPPGIFLSIVGAAVLLVLSIGPVAIGATTFTLNTMVAGLGAFSLGLLLLAFGVFARCYYDVTDRRLRTWRHLLEFNRAVAISFLVASVGILLDVWFVAAWIGTGRRLDESTERISHLATFGIGLVVLAGTLFVLSLMVNALAVDRGVDSNG